MQEKTTTTWRFPLCLNTNIHLYLFPTFYSVIIQPIFFRCPRACFVRWEFVSYSSIWPSGTRVVCPNNAGSNSEIRRTPPLLPQGSESHPMMACICSVNAAYVLKYIVGNLHLTRLHSVIFSRFFIPWWPQFLLGKVSMRHVQSPYCRTIDFPT